MLKNFLIPVGLTLNVSLLSQSCSDSKFRGMSKTDKNSPKSQPSGVSATPSATACVQPSAAANAGKSIEFQLVGFGANSTVAVQNDFGSASISGTTLTYMAPASVSSAQDVALTVNEGSNTTICTVKLIGNGDVVIPDDKKSKGLIAKIYPLSTDSKSMADDFDGKGIAPLGGDYLAPNIEFGGSCSGPGTPGGLIRVKTMADFVISFEGRLNIPIDGVYEFLVGADDGAKMWLAGNVSPVLNADGYARDVSGNLLLKGGKAYHPPGSDINQATVTLKKGWVPIKLNYWQGPCGGYGANLYWRKVGDPSFAVIPASAFDRP